MQHVCLQVCNKGDQRVCILHSSKKMQKSQHAHPSAKYVCSSSDFLETFLIWQYLLPLIILSIIQHDRGPQKDLFLFLQDPYFIPTSYITTLYRNVIYYMSVRWHVMLSHLPFSPSLSPSHYRWREHAGTCLYVDNGIHAMRLSLDSSRQRQRTVWCTTVHGTTGHPPRSRTASSKRHKQTGGLSPSSSAW
jgi:hypothetical protein